MNRIKLNITGKQIFTTQIPVRITDINYGNHMGNHAFAEVVHEARMQWLANCGFTELNITGAGLIMSALVLEFKKEVFYGEKLTVSIFAEVVNKVAFSLYYQIESDNVIVCISKTEMVCFNYANKKVVNIPEKLMEEIR